MGDFDTHSTNQGEVMTQNEQDDLQSRIMALPEIYSNEGVKLDWADRTGRDLAEKMQIISLISGKSIPLHIKRLDLENCTPAQLFQRMKMLSTYNGVQPIDISAISGKLVRVIGAMILDYGVYHGKDEMAHIGYMKLAAKLEQKTKVRVIPAEGEKVVVVERNTVLLTSSKNILMNFMPYLKGSPVWGDFPEGVYLDAVFTQTGPGEADLVEFVEVPGK